MAKATKQVSTVLRGRFKKIADKLKVTEYGKVPRTRKTSTGLKPNAKYSAGKSGSGKPRYKYVTDDQGRIRAAHAQELKLKPDGQPRGWHNSNTPGKLPTDDAGHLFADLFDGSGGLGNLASQARELNQGAWKEMEKGWADALRDGKKVEVLIEVDYGNGVRPSGFNVSTVIDGVQQKPNFFNN